MVVGSEVGFSSTLNVVVTAVVVVVGNTGLSNVVVVACVSTAVSLVCGVHCCGVFTGTRRSMGCWGEVHVVVFECTPVGGVCSEL